MTGDGDGPTRGPATGDDDRETSVPDGSRSRAGTDERPGEAVTDYGGDRRTDDTARTRNDDADGTRNDEGRGNGHGDAAGGDRTTDDGFARTAVHALVATALTVVALVASALGGAPALLVGPDTAAGLVVGLVGGEFGFVAVGLGFLVLTGRGLGYLDLELPRSWRAWGFVAAFTAGLFVARSAVIVGALELGVQPSPSTVSNVDLPPATLTAILLPGMLLVVGPAEELLFRGVVQKFLRETVGAWPAILGAGLLFGSIHLFSLVVASGAGTVLTLLVITGVGVAIGWLYERTGSLPAAMVAHGGYNALIVVTAFGLSVLR